MANKRLREHDETIKKRAIATDDIGFQPNKRRRVAKNYLVQFPAQTIHEVKNAKGVEAARSDETTTSQNPIFIP